MYMSKEIQNVTVSFDFPGLKFGNFVIYKRQKKQTSNLDVRKWW